MLPMALATTAASAFPAAGAVGSTLAGGSLGGIGGFLGSLLKGATGGISLAGKGLGLNVGLGKSKSEEFIDELLKSEKKRLTGEGPMLKRLSGGVAGSEPNPTVISLTDKPPTGGGLMNPWLLSMLAQTGAMAPRMRP